MTTIALAPVQQLRRPPRRLRDIDLPLAAGTLVFGALILLAIYGPLIAPHDLYFSRALFDGKAPPFPPSSEFPFGSDSVGRDRLSWLLIGARGTVVIAFAAAAIRLMLGASLGLIAGFRGGWIAVILRRIALGVSSIPATIATLLAVIALGVNAEQFVIALGLIGWAEPFHQARRYARSETTRPFMESARSLGLSDQRLLLRHLLPNVAPALLTTAAFQVSGVLLLMAELALLNIFVGGAMVVDYDSRGVAIVVPKVPNWASMLATTRPIVSLYGDLAAVLLPGGALLGAVLAINLFGDALASRAQRLDVYRLFSRGHFLGLGALTVGIALSVSVWPTRLGAEVEYARGVDPERAIHVARALANLGTRPNGSAEAERTAVLLTRELEGHIVRGTDTTRRVRDSELVIAGKTAPPGSLTVLSIDDAEVSGPLVLVGSNSLFGRDLAGEISGAVAVITGSSPAFVGNVLRRLVAADARAVIVLDANSQNYRRLSGVYPLPTLRMAPAALASVLNRSLADLRAREAVATLAEQATVRIRTETVEAPIADVIARLPAASSAAPLVMVAARYDSESESEGRWTTATATAALVAIVERLRSTPLDLDVLAVATSTDFQNYAGLRLALTTLDQEERARLQAVVVIGPLLSEALVIETQTDLGMPSGAGRLALRLRDALGVSVSPQPAGELLRAIQAGGAAAPPITFSAAGPDREPAFQTIERAARAVLTALAYVPGHRSEMR